MSGKKLVIYNDPNATPAKVIVISENNINLQGEIDIIGAAAYLLFVLDGQSSDRLSCHSCRFTNVGRVTLASATYDQRKINSLVSVIC